MLRYEEALSFTISLPWKTIYFLRKGRVVANTRDNPIHPPKNPGIIFKIKKRGNEERARIIVRKIEEIVSEGESVRLQDL